MSELGRPLGGERTCSTRACEFFYDPRGFVLAVMRQDLEMQLQDAQEATDAVDRLTGGVRVPVVVDSRGIKYQAKEARDHFISPEADRVSSAVAILVASPVSRLIGNFFLRHSRPASPTRLFSDLERSIEWILEFVPKAD